MNGGSSDQPFDVEAVNDRLAIEHPIDDYYARSPLPIRVIERRRLAAIRAFMGDVGGLDVLEVGSGGGHVLRMFPTARLTAIDVSSLQLDVARRNLTGYDVQFIKGEVDKIELPAAGYDRVICSEVPSSMLSTRTRSLPRDRKVCFAPPASRSSRFPTTH